MVILQTIIAFFVAISFLVFIHEGGHFLVAKWVGVWVHQFAIGFGPAFLRWRGRETEYSLRSEERRVGKEWRSRWSPDH